MIYIYSIIDRQPLLDCKSVTKFVLQEKVGISENSDVDRSTVGTPSGIRNVFKGGQRGFTLAIYLRVCRPCATATVAYSVRLIIIIII